MSFTDRKNQVSTFAYDALNRRVRSMFGDGTFTDFVYDAAGHLVTATDSLAGTITEEYDILNRLLMETTPQGSIQYAYDASGRRTTMTVNGQAPVTYSYDAASRLRTITQAPLTPVDIQYDPSGRRTLLRLPNGVTTAYDYDTASRLTRLTYTSPSALLGDLTYQYDAAGNRVAVGGSFARTLLPDPVASATYDAANQQLAFGTRTMTYDQNGNLTSLAEPTGTTSFTWDARNRLTALSGPTTGGFAYDVNGRRVRRDIGGELREYQYDGVDIVRERINGADTSYLRTLGIDEAVCRIAPEGTSYYLADALSSTVALTDGGGTVSTSYTYEPFGRTTLQGFPGSNPFQYTGRENDGAGLYYYRTRYLSTLQHRFIRPDPLRFAGGDINLYAYVKNSPVVFVDPLGLKIWFFNPISLTGNVGFFAGEGGTYYLVDPFTGDYYQFGYLSGGVGVGTPIGGALQVEGGFFDGPDDPTKISSCFLTVSAFAAAGKGVGGQVTGTSFWGNGEAGATAGAASGFGAGVSGQFGCSLFLGKGNILDDLRLQQRLNSALGGRTPR